MKGLVDPLAVLSPCEQVRFFKGHPSIASPRPCVPVCISGYMCSVCAEPLHHWNRQPVNVQEANAIKGMQALTETIQ